tara:strand:+ start:770 stop:937 length:168 start_codon:yes stop_codon:yes gene_type:complete
MTSWYKFWFAPRPKVIQWNSLSKLELEALGRKHGIEIDRRFKKATLIRQLQKAIV